MKIIYLTLISLFLTVSVFGQSTDDIGKISLSVIMPENQNGLTASQLSKIESKILHIVANAGLASTGYNQNFIIYPKFAIVESNVVEGGMQNITVVVAEISLFIKQVDNNIVFSSISKSLKGSGNNKDAAITNAIANIPVSNLDFKNFIENGKKKIVQYYETKCNDILKKADTYSKTKQYEEAIALLMSVPEEVSCYEKTQIQAIEIYKNYQSENCKGQIQNAKALIAAQDYISALKTLANIDPSTDCFKESQTLMQSVSSKIDAEKKKEWDLQMKMYEDNVKLEKERINAIKEIAVSYYKSQPQNVNYHYIIR